MISVGGGGEEGGVSVSASVRAESSVANGILPTALAILFACTAVAFVSGDEGAGGKLIFMAGLSIATDK